MSKKAARLTVPAEYRKAGIKTPEQAARYSADIIGSVSIIRAHESMQIAREKGWVRVARFYEATTAILLEWYDDIPGTAPAANEPPD